MNKTRRKCSLIFIAVSALSLIVVFDIRVCAQTAATPAPSPSPSPLANTQSQPTPCAGSAALGVLQLTTDATNPDNKLKLARRRFYLSPRPFNLANPNVNLRGAPSLRNFYTSAGASPQLIAWLEENHCETVYCRELTANEVKCEGIDTKKCVPEFTSAYREALVKLKGNQELARKWVTNYPPLSSTKLRTDFYNAKKKWLERAVEVIGREPGSNLKVRSTITDKDGIAFFYDLCPGTYYVSSLAPVEVEGVGLVWETTNPVKIKGPPGMNSAASTTIKLVFPPAKDKGNTFVGKTVDEVIANRKTSAP